MGKRESALSFVVLLGVVSLCADATYEGARSLTGVYLGVLGASGTVVGLVAGLGEFIGYGLRLGIGYVSDRTRAYWRITTLGYAINTIAVPLMALANRWEVLGGFMIAERTGKAIRTPPRDVLLSYGTSQVGRGFGFGLHEAMDQIGAVVGPLMVAGVFALTQHYQWSFAILAIPALIGLVVLLATQRQYPEPRNFETVIQDLDTKRLPTLFWIYLLAVAVLGGGYVDFPLIAFHLQQGNSLPTSQIPLLYALAMGVDAVAALLFGHLLDRMGILALILAVALSVGFAPLVFLSSAVIWGMVLWGIGMGAQESIMRAIVANLVPPERRGSAYGLVSMGYGLAWFLGSLLMGLLYERSLGLLVLVSLVLQLLGLALLLWVRQGSRPPV
ncbi:MFS transporter [Thermosynechococcus sp.]|uniref:MFS transporter n=1 Tax=Thermosynechococcus sp. TaxID=2814275 RepID=UPI0028F3EAEB|nr:MFS transporter [Thermosynechococcus sp.]